MKTSILFVIDNLQFGGGERVFLQIINGLYPNRYHIFLTSLPNGPFYQSITNKHVKYFPLDFSKRVNPRLIFQLRKIIKANNIQIVHGQGTRAEFYARIAHRLAGNTKYISTIAMTVEGFDIGMIRKKIYRIFDRMSEKFVDRFIVVSDSLKDKMIRERGINPKRIIRIYNGIELDQYSPDKIRDSQQKIRKEFNINDATLLIAAVGRLVWQKGFEYLIKAIPDVVENFSNVMFLIVGDGPLKDRLKALGSRLKVNNHLIFTGFRKDIKDVLSATDALVIPSLLEGFPMITLEAMAMSKPIIATRIAGIIEQIIDGESGILIPPKNPVALSQAIRHVLSDHEQMEKLKLNARRRVKKHFSAEKMLLETEKIYQSLLE